jgi:hypothetical protein
MTTLSCGATLLAEVGKKIRKSAPCIPGSRGALAG